MAITIAAYETEHEPLVQAFNARMSALGTHWQFYDKAAPEWLPRSAGAPMWRDYYVAVDDTPAARGAYCLKHQRFLIQGEVVVAAGIQGPVSEGLVDPKFGTMALHLIRDMQQREPNLFCWGASERLLGVLRRMKWTEIQTPVALHVVKAGRFLRMNRFLRTSGKVRLVSDILARTGLGSVLAPLGQFGVRVAAGGLGRRAAKVIEEARFGPWADEVWEAARSAYSFIAERDSVSMNALLPADGWPEATILRLERGGVTIGWAAARDAQLHDNGRFGDMKVGSIVDCLARPGEEATVIDAATHHLRERGVDVIVGNFASPIWHRALKQCGYLLSRNRRLLILSPPLAAKLEGLPDPAAGIHLTLLDGDGPLGL